MIQLSLEEPTIERFFNHSKEEIIQTLRFIAENNLRDFTASRNDYALTDSQKEILASRSHSYHENRSIGRTWDEIKREINR